MNRIFRPCLAFAAATSPVAAVYPSSVALAKDDDRRPALIERRYSLALLLVIVFAAGSAAAAVPENIRLLQTKPLYQFTETETGLYLGHLQSTEPDLRKRIMHLARKNIGQPYELYLLG